MRSLSYKGFILENSAIWEAAKKLRNDPARASLLQIGYRYLCDNPNQNMAYRQKKTWIHPLLRVVLDFAGHSYITWGLCVLAQICDAAYCLYCAITYDGYFYAAVSFVMCLFNLIVYAIVNSVEAKAYNRVMDYSDLKGANKPHNMSEATFLMLMGLEAIGKNCDSHNTTSVSSIRKRLVNRSIVEMLTVHFLLSIPWFTGVVVNLKTHLVREEVWLALLSASVLYAKLSMVLNGAQAAFFIRLNQRLVELETRRVQLEVRTATTKDVQNLPVRVKRLLIESHSITNKEHSFYVLWGPVILFQLALLGIGIIQAQNVTNGEQYCIPYWVFLSELQPLLSIMVMTHGFARLNLFMERDVEQDITELALSMSYLKGKKGGKEGEDDDHKIDNIIQQLRLLERLDSRPCVLNFDFVPTMESSRALIRVVFTGIGLLGPYILVALGSSMSDGYMCLD
ncbi:hypothetical protein TrLO_g1569 [Triparma laevis f. longispina]|uniref:Uncharacterized protein n=1 Tax=Triparma laevis f. longispina TaxID=1714387 RepID=A0A9W6ZXT9_9STRA|nr:hypothetical protein TrLO_g1569 [Triparma laevis f. longispina]